jgi:hypothetical protein
MGVAEILKHVRALSPRDRQRLVKSVLALEKAPKRPKKRRAKGKVVWPDILERQRKIFGDRVLPNLVLLEREDYKF